MIEEKTEDQIFAKLFIKSANIEDIDDAVSWQEIAKFESFRDASKPNPKEFCDIQSSKGGG